MAKRKNWLDQLIADRYFVWAVVFVVIVGTGLLAQITLANIQMDAEAVTIAYVVVPHNAHQVAHKK